jgi:ribosomal protein S12 methylthiotransferase accessory factor YcaO
MHYHSPYLIAHVARSAFGLADPVIGLPVNVGLVAEEAGNSVDFGGAAYAAALGEYLERQHFFNFVPVHAHKPLGVACDEALRASLVHALAQTRTARASVAGLDRRAFDLVRVTDLASGRAALLPHCLVALSHDDAYPDADLYPLRDTCACGVHVDPAASLDAALREFAERQTLIAAWIRGTPQRELAGVDRFCAAHPRLARVHADLASVGTVRVVSLDGGLPGYTLFAFLSAAAPDQVTQFACGMAHAHRPEHALQKAILELWHTFVSVPRKLADADDPESRTDRLDRHLLAFNRPDAARGLRFLADARGEAEPERTEVEAFCRQPACDRRTLLAALTRIAERIYWYSNSMAWHGRTFVFSRVLSPDFFLHMDTSAHLNLDNAYGRWLGLDPEAFDGSAIPFP